MDTKFQTFGGHPVKFISTAKVVPGVNCDVYEYIGKESECDLGIVTVAPSMMTPRQQVCDGITTIEQYVSGAGTLFITRKNGIKEVFNFPDKELPNEIEVKIGDEMQWHANGEAGLVFAEICYPPYEDGRFEDL